MVGTWLVITSCTSTQRESKDEKKAQLYLEIGTAHLTKGNYPQALRELLNAERFDAKNHVIQNNLGLAYMVRDRFDDAERHFLKALDLKDDFTDARNNLGRLYVEAGAYPKAIETLKIAAADLTYLNPDKTWSNLGHAYFMSKQFPEAKNAFQKSLGFRRGSCFTLNYYGRSLYEIEKFKEAAESLDQAIKTCEKSKFEEPYYYSALSFYKLGNIDMARARLREVLAYFPKGQFESKASELLEIMK